MQNFKRYSWQSLAFFYAHWKGVLVLAYLPNLLPEIYYLIDNEQRDNWALSLMIFPFYIMFSVAFIFYIDGQSRFRQNSGPQLHRLALKFLAPYFFVIIIATLAVLFSSLALIIPGIYVLVKYSFITFNLLLDETGINGAFKLSWKQTKGYFWLLFSAFFIYVLVPGLPGFIAQIVPQEFNFSQAANHSQAIESSNIIYLTVGTLGYIFYTLFTYQVYKEVSKKWLDDTPTKVIDTPSEIIK